MAPLDKKGVADETEAQKRAREGFNNLAHQQYDETIAVVQALLKDKEEIEKDLSEQDKNTWATYAGLLAHCLLCWRPDMRDRVGKVDADAAERLVKLPDADQEEYFIFSQRLEDSTDDRVAGVGMYLHAVLLIATGDAEHAVAVIKDSADLHEPLSSMMLAEQLMDIDPKNKDIVKFLQVGINEVQPCALELASTGKCSSFFSEEEREQQAGIVSMIYEANGGAKEGALVERSRFLSAAENVRPHPDEISRYSALVHPSISETGGISETASPVHSRGSSPDISPGDLSPEELSDDDMGGIRRGWFRRPEDTDSPMDEEEEEEEEEEPDFYTEESDSEEE